MQDDDKAALAVATSEAGITRVTLNRPHVHNAFDEQLIAQLTSTLADIAAARATRVLILDASGKSFSAGADLNWMKRTATYSELENKRDALALTEMLHTLNTFPHPTLAAVQGAALGGGVGLVACCDMAIAADRAFFALSEVKLGLIPSAISPFVIEAIGQRAARRYFLSAERFNATTAMALGLIHETVTMDQLHERVNALADSLLECGPKAQREAKALIMSVSGRTHDEALMDETASRIARVRASDEGREGIAAFLEKRQPAWCQPDSDECPES